ncbi:hypothetical protein V6615_16360 (plasmid) [Oscillospiraceae bacterium PP1C4]
MNIATIKAQADAKELEKQELEQIRLNILETVHTHEEKAESFYKIWDKKMCDAFDYFIEEYKSWFITHGFTLNALSPTVLDATYKTETFRLFDLNSNGEKMNFVKVENFSFCVDFRLDSPDNTRCWRNIVVDGIRDIDNCTDYKVDYNKFLSQFHTKKQLDEVSLKLQANIEQLESSWSTLKDAKICIITYKDNRAYTSVADFIDSINW